MNESVFTEFPELKLNQYDLKAISVNDLPEIEELCSYRPPERSASAKELLKKINAEYESKNGINWGVYHADKLIGTIGFYRGFENNEAEIGYVLLKAYRNQNITTLAVKLLVKFAFEQMGTVLVKAYSGSTNTASHKVLLKSKFSQVKSDIPNDLKFEIRPSNL